MTDVTESERHSSNGDCDREESGSDRPAQTLRPVEELLPRCHVPADLEMHGKGTNEDYMILVEFGSRLRRTYSTQRWKALQR